MRLIDNGPRHGYALLLAAGQLRRLAVGQRRDLHQFKDSLDAPFDLRFRQAFHPQAKGDIVPDGEMRKKSVSLKHHFNRALPRRKAVRLTPANPDRACVREVQTAQDAQQSGFAAARRSQQRKEFALANAQADVIEHNSVAKAAHQILDFNRQSRQSGGWGTFRFRG